MSSYKSFKPFSGQGYTTGSVIAAAAKQAIKMYKAASAYKAKKINIQPKKKKATKSRLVRVNNVAKGDGIETKFDLTNKPSEAIKVMKKLTAVNTFCRQFGIPIPWDVGRQAVNDASVSFDQFNLQQLYARLPVTDLSGNLNRRMLLDRFNSETTFSNGTNASCYVHVYDVMAKHDIDSVDTSLISPAVAWQSGELQQGNTVGVNLLGTEPKKAELFKQHYKILQHTKHFMKPGDIHKHHVSINFNKFVNEARIANSKSFSGMTIWTMIVCHGTPGQDDTPITPVVSTTAGVINMTQTTNYSYRWTQDKQNSNAVNGTLLQPAALEVVQEDGDIDVVTNA